MRMLLAVESSVESGNATVKDESLSTKVQSILEEQKPEVTCSPSSSHSKVEKLA